MYNSFVASVEKLNGEHMESYMIGFHNNDIKDITIQLLKLIYKKIDKIKFLDEKKSTTIELANKKQFVLLLDNNQIPLSQNDIDVLTSFLLDATEEYMAYDHIDLEFQIENTEIDICFMRI